jgi:hypothetical protein
MASEPAHKLALALGVGAGAGIVACYTVAWVEPGERCRKAWLEQLEEGCRMACRPVWQEQLGHCRMAWQLVHCKTVLPHKLVWLVDCRLAWRFQVDCRLEQQGWGACTPGLALLEEGDCRREGCTPPPLPLAAAGRYVWEDDQHR